MRLVTKTFTFEGKRYYVRAKTERLATEKMIRKRLELEEGARQIGKNMRADVWAKEWIETYKRPSVSNSWLKAIESIVSGCILPSIGALQLKSIKPTHLQKIINAKSDCSKSYIRKIYNVMHEMFQTAFRNGLILENPCDAVTLPIGKRKVSRRSITRYEREMILSVCERHRFGLFVKIMLYCGLRPGEAAALRWNDVNLSKKTLSVTKALKKDGTIGDPKSESGFRVVPLPDVLLKDLSKVEHGPYDLICTNARGDPLTTSSIKQAWKSFIYHLNIEMGCQTFKGGLIPPYRVADDLVMYCLRHTYCTDLQAAGVPINVARELMGHSDISMTAEIYTHSSLESFTDAINKINALECAREESKESTESI